MIDYRKILDQLPDLIYVTKADGITPVFFNERWYEFTGYNKEEALYKNWESIIDPRDMERISKDIAEAVESNSCYEVELRLRDNRTGDSRWYLSRGCPVIENDALVAYVGTSIDIHDRKIAIRDLEAVLSNVIDQRTKRIQELEKKLKKSGQDIR